MTIKSYSQILEQAKNSLKANQSKLTDFNDGSVIVTVLQAFSRLLERFYIDTRINYDNNLKATPYSVFEFSKKSGNKATVQVKFFRSKAATTAATIPSGTIVSNGTYKFETSQTATIPADETESNLVSAQAEDIGIEYNVGAEEISIVESIVSSEIAGVTNPVKASGGSNDETDSELQSRFKQYINGLQGTNIYGLKSAVLNIEGVRSVSLDEHFPPKNDIYNATLYVDDGTGNLTTTLKNTIQDTIDGDDSSTNPGKRAAGVNIDIQPATPVPINISVKVTVYRVEDATAKFDIQTALEDQINGLGINENVVLTDIILRLRQLSYVKDVQIISVNDGKDNIPIAVNQIARLGTVTITLEDWK